MRSRPSSAPCRRGSGSGRASWPASGSRSARPRTAVRRPAPSSRSRSIAAGSTPSCRPRYTRGVRARVEQVVALVLRVVHAETSAGCTRSADAPGARGCRRPSCRGSRSGSGTRRRSAHAPPRPAARAAGGRRGRATAVSSAHVAEARAAGCSPPARSRSTSRSSPRRGSRSQTSFIHCPPHGAGSKNGTTRNGRRAARRRPSRTASPRASFGACRVVGVEDEVPARDQRPLQPVGHAPVHEEGALVLQAGRSRRLSTPRLPVSLRRNRSCASQRARSA